MNDGTARTVALVALAFGVGLLAVTVRKQRNLAISTVNDIESQIAALDPATRAGVIARLTKDSIDAVRSNLE